MRQSACQWVLGIVPFYWWLGYSFALILYQAFRFLPTGTVLQCEFNSKLATNGYRSQPGTVPEWHTTFAVLCVLSTLKLVLHKACIVQWWLSQLTILVDILAVAGSHFVTFDRYTGCFHTSPCNRMYYQRRPVFCQNHLYRYFIHSYIVNQSTSVLFYLPPLFSLFLQYLLPKRGS